MKNAQNRVLLFAERLDALAAVEKLIVALRREGKEEEAYKALTDAIDRGEITIEEASAGCYEPDPLRAPLPRFFVRWNMNRQGLPSL